MEAVFRLTGLDAGLWLAAVLSGLLVVWSTHQTRELLAELMRLQAHANSLQVVHGRYLIQEGALTSPGRLEQVAKERLQMHIPDPSEIMVIRQ